MGDPEKNNSQPSGGATAGSGGCDGGPRGGGVGGGAVASRSWGATASGPSISTTSGGSTGSQSSLARASHGDDVGCGSVGSPSSLAMATTPARDTTFLRMNQLDIQGDDAGSLGDVGSKKKKRGQRATAGDKSGRGLRQFSVKVCEKVESKGRTTYNEVADELVAEFADPGNSAACPDQQQYDEKNIRRRVYDALNVLMAMDIISKDKKEITWKGLPRTSLSDIEELKKERQGLRSRIEKKVAYLQELEEQYIGLQKLIQRNEQLFNSGNGPTGGIALPFILVQTRPHATVEVEISEDMQLVHFDFNSTPFELHDDNYVLKAMKLCERTENIAINPEFPSSGGEGSSMYQPHITPSVTTPSEAERHRIFRWFFTGFCEMRFQCRINARIQIHVSEGFHSNFMLCRHCRYPAGRED